MAHVGTEDTDMVMLSPQKASTSGLDPLARSPATSTDAQWEPRVVAQQLVRAEAKVTFAQNIFEIYKFWLQLVHSTTLSQNMTSMDAGVVAAFQAIDNVIESNAYRLARLAYARLPVVMSSLHAIISVDRKQGRIHTAAGYRNASVALDIYLSAQRSGVGVMRKKLAKRVRLANRWAHLGGSQPLLLVSFPEVADNIIGSHAVTDDNLRALANETLHACPSELVRASACLSNTVELILTSGTEFDVYHAYGRIMELKQTLE